SVANGFVALERMEAFGEPELIVSDHKILEETGNSLYHHLSANDLLIPLIICSGSIDYEYKERTYPLVSAFVQKPFSIESLSYLVKSITTEKIAQPSFIAVKLPILLSFINKSFDLYLKLSEANYVKIIKQGEAFTKEDSDKFLKKGISHLYISIKDSFEFLKAYEENLNLVLSSKSVNNETNIVHTIDVLVSIESVSKRLNWTPELIQSAKKNIDTAIKILSKDAALRNVLKNKLANPSSSYSRHVGLLSYMCSIFSQNLDWGGDTVQTKLVMAALLHDLAVDESYYDDIKNWNKKAANLRDRTPETIKYRLHPLDASKLLQPLENLPPDIELILLQHHEKKDGSGFPRALTSTRISQLATFFNIVEELVEFIGDGENLETSLTDFKMWGDAYYESGHYKKTYEFIRKKIG
nr:hypothetical protein [Bdellovibrionales bacterium]